VDAADHLTPRPNAITLSLHASGVFDGSTCDTGPVSLTLDQAAI
jgi:hypothetical protein